MIHGRASQYLIHGIGLNPGRCQRIRCIRPGALDGLGQCQALQIPQRDVGLLPAAGSRCGSGRTKDLRIMGLVVRDCGKSKYRDNPGGKIAYLYCITDGVGYKVGWAINPEKRLKQLQTGNPRQLRIHARLRCSCTAQAMMRERNLHKRHRKHRLIGEWFTDAIANNPFGKYGEGHENL